MHYYYLLLYIRILFCNVVFSYMFVNILFSMIDIDIFLKLHLHLNSLTFWDECFFAESLIRILILLLRMYSKCEAIPPQLGTGNQETLYADKTKVFLLRQMLFAPRCQETTYLHPGDGIANMTIYTQGQFCFLTLAHSVVA